MSTFDPATSILAGMDTAVLQAELTALQQVYLALSRGEKVASASYAQGNGQKTVTFAATDLAKVATAIRQIQAQLGIICTPRRALGVKF